MFFHNKTIYSIISLLCSLVVFSHATIQTVCAYGEVQLSGSYCASLENCASHEYLMWLEQMSAYNFSSTGNVILTPGSNSHTLNFSWYDKVENTFPAVAVSESPLMTSAKIFEGTNIRILRSNGYDTFRSANHVCVDNYFKKEMIYYYCTTSNIRQKNPVWSKAKPYRHGSDTNYSVLLVGDAQIGASGQILPDTYSWNQTLQMARRIVPAASFLISAGDQVNMTASTNDGLREQQYAGFLYPDILRSLPVVTTVGNHDANVADYSYHFYNPNTKKKRGATSAGCDYYFTRGNALFIVLNSNNRNYSSHYKLMQKAVKDNPGATWRIAVFHHDIYGSGISHSNKSAANARIIFAPLMDAFHIDIAFSGHDHSYACSYPMFDGTALIPSTRTRSSQFGTTYVSLGSSTGSKMYGLVPKRQYYIAERSNNPVATFSSLSVSPDTLTLKTYDQNGLPYADDVVIKKQGAEKNPLAPYRKAKK